MGRGRREVRGGVGEEEAMIARAVTVAGRELEAETETRWWKNEAYLSFLSI